MRKHLSGLHSLRAITVSSSIPSITNKAKRVLDHPLELP
jgi:hypothetical protein